MTAFLGKQLLQGYSSCHWKTFLHHFQKDVLAKATLTAFRLLPLQLLLLPVTSIRSHAFIKKYDESMLLTKGMCTWISLLRHCDRTFSSASAIAFSSAWRSAYACPIVFRDSLRGSLTVLISSTNFVSWNFSLRASTNVNSLFALSIACSICTFPALESAFSMPWTGMRAQLALPYKHITTTRV